MKKKLNVLWTVVLVVIILGMVVFIGGIQGMKEVRAYKLPAVDMSQIEDGEYKGSCDIGRFAMDVRVTVKDHMVVAVSFIDGKKANATDALVSKMNEPFLNKKDPIFDAITGATITSKAYAIAVTKALLKKEEAGSQ